MSFVDSEPVKLDDNELHLAFRSSTLMDKVANAKNQTEILKAFENVLNIKINLKLELKKIRLQPVSQAEEKTDKPSVIDMAKEVFGS